MESIISYRLASENDIDRINEFYFEIYKRKRTYDEFYWEYYTSPAGKVIYVLAECDGHIVGTQCAIPYSIIQNNTVILSAKSEDTLVSPNFRGKRIFENMYTLLFEECKNKNIEFIWGFTYASKPFQKIGFEIPFKSSLGLLAIKPIQAANYFKSITSDKTSLAYLKILALTTFSSIKFQILKLNKKNKGMRLNNDFHELSNSATSYIDSSELFGIKLDSAFINYRIQRNPYSSNYQTVNYFESKKLFASVCFNITKDDVGFIVHLNFDKGLDETTKTRALQNIILGSTLRTCSVIRFWGFTHNQQNLTEVKILKKVGFTFLNRGISFVGKKLNSNSPINFSDFVLSRMASQGTD